MKPITIPATDTPQERRYNRLDFLVSPANALLWPITATLKKIVLDTDIGLKKQSYQNS